MGYKGFNLLRPQITPEDQWDKIYTWVNTSARVIVIFVELIVIVCFAARVVVDRKARDLMEEVKSNHERLANLADAESEINITILDQQVYRGLWNSSSGFAPYITEVYALVPSMNSLINVTIDGEGQLDVTGVANRDLVSELEAKMKNSLSYKTVELSSFRPDPENTTGDGSFQIKAQINNVSRIPIKNT